MAHGDRGLAATREEDMAKVARRNNRSAVASRPTLGHFLAAQPAAKERFAAGKALRLEVPRANLGEFRPSPRRKDPVAILEAQGKTRLQKLLPIRYARMLASPFSFLRGAAAIMAQDLHGSAVTGIDVQVCGDMHVANFGVFASAERNLIFGINDFDETIPGPWEWDLKRLVASIVVAGRFLGADRELCAAASHAAVSSYRRHIRAYAGMGYLEIWYATIKEADLLAALSSPVRRRAEQIFAKAKGRDHLQVLEKLTDLVDDKHHIVEDAPLIVRDTQTESGKPLAPVLDLVLGAYLASLPHDRQMLISRYRLVDVARKVVGVGSVGTRCWILLFQGAGAVDPLFLQVKEAQQSVLAPYLDNAPHFASQGQRVVVGQRLIQPAPDIFLGWAELHGFHYYMRQLRDMKGGVEFDPDNWRPQGMLEYSAICAWALALAHAKSGDAAMIAGYAGKSEALDDALTGFAFAYADQTERDHAALEKAARTRRIPVAKIS
jgi:uncharacterized protein (DUF2252 family)